MAERFTFFYASDSVFSNWHPSPFVIDDIEFNCNEQYMMWAKAMLFGDTETAQRILAAKHPRDHKALGRAVTPFNEPVWDFACKLIVFRGVVAKFTQNPPMLAHLVATQGTTLVEASPSDKIWGIGLGADDPRAQTRATWLGTNYLGEIETTFRDALILGISGLDEVMG